MRITACEATLVVGYLESVVVTKEQIIEVSTAPLRIEDLELQDRNARAVAGKAGEIMRSNCSWRTGMNDQILERADFFSANFNR